MIRYRVGRLYATLRIPCTVLFDDSFFCIRSYIALNISVLFSGLRSYGKVVYVFSLVPVLGILVMSSKLLSLTPLHRGLFPQTDWSEFFLNAKSWISAATEVTLTWNLLGAATMQVTSHNRVRKKLWRDVAAIALLTLMVLILAAFLGNTCHQVLSSRGYTYIPSSFGEQRRSRHPHPLQGTLTLTLSFLPQRGCRVILS